MSCQPHRVAHEGMQQVLDRVMLRTGSKSWWGNLAVRARAQRMWAEHKRGRKAVSHDINPFDPHPAPFAKVTLSNGLLHRGRC